MSKNSSSLKQAIHTLNIKKPFDLRNQNSPGLKAPVILETSPSESDETEPAQIVHVKTEPAQLAPTDPVAEVAKPKVAVGFFMLAHSVFQNEAIRKLSGDSFRVFIWMSAQAWRFKESSGSIRAAVDYISLGCGCSRSTVTRALNDLKASKLIECVEQNFKKGNLWQITRVADGRPIEVEDAQIEQTHSEQTQQEQEAGPVRVRSLFKMTTEHAQNEQQIITPNKNKNSEEARAEVFEALKERENIWEKFRSQFPTESQQMCEIEGRLVGLPFTSKQKFACDMAVMQWWE